jgi:hypothetical protein
MASCSLQLSGTLIVGGDGCGCGEGAGQKIQPLAFACSSTYYGAIASTDCAQQVLTAGAIGDNWAELPIAGALGAFHLLFVKSNAPIRLRIGADAAELAGAGAVFPHVFAGGETFAFDVDGVSVPVSFTAGSKTAAVVAQVINQAAIGAGLSFLPASVGTDGQLRLRGLKTGSQGSVDITTALAAIGYASADAEALGEGSDVDVNGLFMTQFNTSGAPTRIQVSGSAQIEVLAAGSAPA